MEMKTGERRSGFARGPPSIHWNYTQSHVRSIYIFHGTYVEHMGIIPVPSDHRTRCAIIAETPSRTLDVCVIWQRQQYPGTRYLLSNKYVRKQSSQTGGNMLRDAKAVQTRTKCRMFTYSFGACVCEVYLAVFHPIFRHLDNHNSSLLFVVCHR